MEKSLFEKYNNLTVIKPRKDNDRRELIAKLSEATGRTPKSIVFSFIGMPDKWIQDALNHCLHYSSIKARNHFLSDWLKKTKE